MIKELINFSKSLTDDFKNLGKTSKEGLHILMQVKADGMIHSSANSIEFEYFGKKIKI